MRLGCNLVGPQADAPGEAVMLGTDGKVPIEMLPEGAGGSGIVLSSTRRITTGKDFIQAIRDNAKSESDSFCVVYSGTATDDEGDLFNVSVTQFVANFASITGGYVIPAYGVVYTTLPISVVGIQYVDATSVYFQGAESTQKSGQTYNAGASADIVELTYKVSDGGGEPDILTRQNTLAYRSMRSDR